MHADAYGNQDNCRADKTDWQKERGHWRALIRHSYDYVDCVENDSRHKKDAQSG